MSTAEQKLTFASNAHSLRVNFREARQLTELLGKCGLCRSKSEGMRLIKNGAVYITLGDEPNSTILRVGSRHFSKVIWR